MLCDRRPTCAEQYSHVAHNFYGVFAHVEQGPRVTSPITPTRRIQHAIGSTADHSAPLSSPAFSVSPKFRGTGRRYIPPVSPTLELYSIEVIWKRFFFSSERASRIPRIIMYISDPGMWSSGTSEIASCRAPVLGEFQP